MESTFKEAGQMVRKMDQEFKFIKMEEYFWVSLNKESNLVSVELSVRMDRFLLDHF